MTSLELNRTIGLLRRVLRDAELLYRNSGKTMVAQHPSLLDGRPERFVELMEDLCRGLLLKVYVTVVRADQRWSSGEKRVAAALIEFLWNERLSSTELQEAAKGLFEQADRLTWDSLLAPFHRYQPLHEHRAHVETIVMRLANLVVKCDGQSMPEEAEVLHHLQDVIDDSLYGHSKSSATQSPTTKSHSGRSQQLTQQDQANAQEYELVDDSTLDAQARAKQLQSALAQLDRLVGLDGVKERVRSYTNFLKLQDQRRAAGLRAMPLSLHMAFVGNPGTGKTTVARIVGQILGAMGTLATGHVVETDRSGLVAEYAGQTAVKTNTLCDSALGGILFIDEAYSLVDASGDDAYGREAIQTLLKRMEDNRAELVVILAGYSDEMDRMIRSNPGLSSRINTRIEFDDYSPIDMARIFERLAHDHQYKLPAEARHRLLVGLDHLYHERDRHFGNGRLVRNVFEESVRQLANRVADVLTLSEDLLTHFTEKDICFADIAPQLLDELVRSPHRLMIGCKGCEKRIQIQPVSLGKRVRCRTCETVQPTDWAEIDRTATA